jgi:hypothetical protein
MFRPFPFLGVVDHVGDLIAMGGEEFASYAEKRCRYPVPDSLAGWTEDLMGPFGSITPCPVAPVVDRSACVTDAGFLQLQLGVIRVVIQLPKKPIMSALAQVIYRFP